MRAVLCLLDAPSSHPFRLLRGPPLTPLSPPHPTSSGSANPLGAISKESRQTASRHPCCRRRSGPPPPLGEAVRRAALPTSTSPLLRTSPLSGGVKATVLHHLDFPLTPAPRRPLRAGPTGLLTVVPVAGVTPGLCRPPTGIFSPRTVTRPPPSSLSRLHSSVPFPTESTATALLRPVTRPSPHQVPRAVAILCSWHPA